MIINSNFFTDPWAHGRAYFGKGQGDIYISILTMFNAIEVRVTLKSVHPVMLEIMTVAIQRMLESAVKVCVWISIIILHFREKHG